MKKQLLAISAALALAGVAVPAMAENQSGYVDGVKTGDVCAVFAVGGVNYGTGGAKGAGLVDAWSTHQIVGFDVGLDTISCQLDGQTYTLPLARDITYGTLSFN